MKLPHHLIKLVYLASILECPIYINSESGLASATFNTSDNTVILTFKTAEARQAALVKYCDRCPLHQTHLCTSRTIGSTHESNRMLVELQLQVPAAGLSEVFPDIFIDHTTFATLE